jgi:outer membrane usher protein
MRSYDANLVSISPADIPLDVTLNNNQMTVRPQDRSGVVVKFPLKFSHGALVRLVDEAGKPIAVGSTVTLRSTGIMFPTGYDGEVYMKNLEPKNEVSVELENGGRCSATFNYRPIPGQIPTVGPVKCIGDKQ